jgi:hypothetical protein
MKSTKWCLKSRGWGRWGLNLFKVYCTNLWNCHNETSSYYHCMLIKSKIKKFKCRKLTYARTCKHITNNTLSINIKEH